MRWGHQGCGRRGIRKGCRGLQSQLKLRSCKPFRPCIPSWGLLLHRRACPIDGELHPNSLYSCWWSASRSTLSPTNKRRCRSPHCPPENCREAVRWCPLHHRLSSGLRSKRAIRKSEGHCSAPRRGSHPPSSPWKKRVLRCFHSNRSMLQGRLSRGRTDIHKGYSGQVRQPKNHSCKPAHPSNRFVHKEKQEPLPTGPTQRSELGSEMS